MSAAMKNVINLISENDVKDARKTITKLNTEIRSYQSRLMKSVEKRYVHFLPEIKNDEFFLLEGERLDNQATKMIESVESEIETNVQRTNDELNRNFSEILESKRGLQVSLKLLRIHERFKELRQAIQKDDFAAAINTHGELKCMLDDPSDPILQKLECYGNIKVDLIQDYEQLMFNINKKFDSLVEFKEKTFQSTKAVSIRVTKDAAELKKTLSALVTIKYNPRIMCHFLMENVFEPLLTRPVSIEYKEDDLNFYCLQLSYALSPLDSLRPHYRVVFDSIRLVFNCLSHLNFVVVEEEEEQCIFKIFANHIKDSFFDLLLSECLSYAIPGTVDEMNQSTLVDDIKTLHNYLTEVQFLSADNAEDRRLLNYCDRIEILFRKRFCSNLLSNSVGIMRKDLHDMIETELEERCMISKSTLELIKLIERIVQQSKSFGDDTAADLVSTIVSILERYVEEVAEHHDKLLTNIPQQSALFYNNCLFLAQWTIGNLNKHSSYYESLAHYLQSQGAELFSTQVQRQKKQLVNNLNEINLSEYTEDLGPEPLRIIRQCLLQLELLKNVWQSVLQESSYNETIARLLNEFCSELIRKISKMEDISSSVATSLEDIIALIVNKAPSLFRDPLTVNTSVSCWMKLIQLKMILGASLLQITEQWSEGKGPLTLNFKAEEVKHLIRALFQNTDRRAAALASIV